MKSFKIILILISVGAIFYFGWNFLQNEGIDSNGNKIPVIDTKILGNEKDLVSFSVEPGSSVSGILAVTGSVQGGYFFEGNIIINILDSDKKIIRKSNGNAITDWTTIEPVGFNAVIDFTYLPLGPAFIEIHNDNPGSPNEGIDKSILIPIIIK